jgi:8-hydroxy-5-deazaflavin:NADPH oxidoreductase
MTSDTSATTTQSESPAATIVLDDAHIGIIGGTGEQGRGLAQRFAASGLRVTVGSRDADRAQEVTASMPGVRGTDNRTCAQDCDIAIIAVPWAAHADTIAPLADVLADKVVVDCVNPLGFDAKGAFALDVPEGSAAAQAAALLPDSVVTAAFHHVSAVLLLDDELESIDTDVLVLGDDRAATDLVAALAAKIPGVRGIYGGRLRNAGQVEAFTANLISMNRRYKAHAGIRVTDVD